MDAFSKHSLKQQPHGREWFALMMRDEAAHFLDTDGTAGDQLYSGTIASVAQFGNLGKIHFIKSLDSARHFLGLVQTG